jgi:hypothetical protein
MEGIAMDIRPRRQRFLCSVCTRESADHSGWFLVVENQWCDRLKVLRWHPLLAQQAHIRSVCGRLHLKLLINHWFAYSNLEYLTREPESAVLDPCEVYEPVYALTSDGRLLGELAVHRESPTNNWSGSPETLESILDALVADPEERGSEGAGRKVATTRMTIELENLAAESALLD